MTRTELESRQNPGGLFAIEDASRSTGSRFYVDSGSATGADAAGYGLSPDAPFLTLDYAIASCAENNGDIIYVMPGHAETTTAIALDVAGIKIIGLGWGRSRPTFTATTGASNLVNVTVANVWIENLRFVGAASGVLALLANSSAGTDLVVLGCSFEHGATPLLACAMSGSRFRFQGCTWLGTANGPDAAIDLQAHLKDWVVSDCQFLYGSYGLDLAVISSLVDAQEGYLIENVRVVGIDTLLVNIASSTAAPPDGFFASGDVMASAPVSSTEVIVAAATSKGMAFGRVFAVDAVAVSGVRVPLVTAS